ncbi:MAG: hypothetical protein IJZ90_03695, partial [Clostridia bacterium]|nr:hypothetical protein [Clostridia bacterium]
MKACIARIKERPVLMVFIAITTFIFCIIEQYNPLTKEYGSLGKLLEYSYVDLLSSLANWFASKATSPALMAVTVVVAIIFMFAISSVIGIFYAGYSHVLYLSLIDHAPKKGEFKTGINKNFLKIALYFTAVIAFSLVFIVLAAYSIIPAAMTIKQLLAGDTSVILQMVFLCLLTVVILFFAMVFYAMYMSFVLPGLIGFKHGGVGVSMRMVNGYCWYLIPRTLAYLLAMGVIDVLMLAVGYGASSVGLGIVVLLVNTVLKFLCNFVYIY